MRHFKLYQDRNTAGFGKIIHPGSEVEVNLITFENETFTGELRSEHIVCYTLGFPHAQLDFLLSKVIDTVIRKSRVGEKINIKIVHKNDGAMIFMTIEVVSVITSIPLTEVSDENRIENAKNLRIAGNNFYKNRELDKALLDRVQNFKKK